MYGKFSSFVHSYYSGKAIKNNYEQLKKEYERLNSLPNKTKEIKAEQDKIKHKWIELVTV